MCVRDQQHLFDYHRFSIACTDTVLCINVFISNVLGLIARIEHGDSLYLAGMIEGTLHYGIRAALQHWAAMGQN
jgi:hypothetical protein